jgi:hypothetical protein
VDLFQREDVRTKHSESRVNSAQAAPTSTPAPAPCGGTHGRRCCQSMRHAPAARFRVSASTVLLGVGLVPELVEGRRALPAHRPRGRALTHAQRLNLAFSVLPNQRTCLHEVRIRSRSAPHVGHEDASGNASGGLSHRPLCTACKYLHTPYIVRERERETATERERELM